jgi:hypothetical protein
MHLRVEVDNAIAFRIFDVIAKNETARGEAGPFLKEGGKVMAVKDVVAEDKADGRVIDEGSSNKEGLGKTSGFWLNGILEAESELGAVAKKLFKTGGVLGSGDDEDFADAGGHEDGKRIVDHRLVIDGKKLLAKGDRRWIEAGAAPSG